MAASETDSAGTKMADGMRKFTQDLDQWAAKQAQQADQTTRAHLSAVKQDEYTVTKLQAEESALRDLLAEQGEETEESREAIAALQREIEALTTQLNTLPHQLSDAEQVLQNSQQASTAASEEAGRTRDGREVRLRDLLKGTTFFQQRLGLDLSLNEGPNKLKVTYRMVDPRDDERPFSFIVEIRPNGTYEVRARRRFHSIALSPILSLSLSFFL
jgi:hypothetical protein